MIKVGQSINIDGECIYWVCILRSRTQPQYPPLNCFILLIISIIIIILILILILILLLLIPIIIIIITSFPKEHIKKKTTCWTSLDDLGYQLGVSDLQRARNGGLQFGGCHLVLLCAGVGSRMQT